MALLICLLWVSKERVHERYLNRVDFSSIGHSTKSYDRHRNGNGATEILKIFFGNGMARGTKWEHGEVAQVDFSP